MVYSLCVFLKLGDSQMCSNQQAIVFSDDHHHEVNTLVYKVLL